MEAARQKLPGLNLVLRRVTGLEDISRIFLTAVALITIQLTATAERWQSSLAWWRRCHVRHRVLQLLSCGGVARIVRSISPPTRRWPLTASWA